MTGTIALSAVQFDAIHERVHQQLLFGDTLARVVIHPAADHAVRVVFSYVTDDVLQGHFYALRSGETLTGKEFGEYEGRRVRA